jgi:hypothetical protein
LTHTFYQEPWPVCETRYFYFWGTRIAELMPSTSPIFSYHRYAPGPLPPSGYTLLINEPWTYRAPFPNWYFFWGGVPKFDPAHYVTPPTCLSAWSGTGTWNRGTTILTSKTNIPELCLINRARFEFLASECHHDYFRMQAYPITPNYTPWNTYGLRFYSGMVQFYYTINGASSSIAQLFFTTPLALNTWHTYRFILRDRPNRTNPTSIAYQFDLWENGAWHTYLQGTSTVNLWHHSLTNYYAFLLQCRGGYAPEGTSVDDTEIWTPVYF